MRAREGRDYRRSVLTATHRHVLSIVGFHLQIDVGTAEEFILDSKKVSLFIGMQSLTLIMLGFLENAKIGEIQYRAVICYGIQC